MEVDEKNLADPVSITPKPPDPFSTVSSIPSRVKLYPDGSTGSFVVYFRPKIGPKSKPLNIIQISKDLESHFKSIIEISKVRPNKLRVVVKDLTQANKIATSEFFTREYHVYVPARDVEIDGVVTDSSLSSEFLLKDGVGYFKNTSIPTVKILDCQQLRSVSFVEGKKIYSPSDSFRVTFAGSALPSHISIHNVLVPVRLYIPRVMNCTNCKQLGHTSAYCCNKSRCGKCGGNHLDDSCNQENNSCYYCGETKHELSNCSLFIQHKIKMKRSLKDRAKRSYSDLLKQSETNSLISSNIYDLLSSDETDCDVPLAGPSFSNPGWSRKRKNLSSPKLPNKGPKISLNRNGNVPKSNHDTEKSNQTSSRILNLKSTQEFPPLSPKNCDSSFTPSNNQTKSGILKFSHVINWILESLNIPDPFSKFIHSLLPVFKTFLKQLTSQWPLISTLISFDD